MEKILAALLTAAIVMGGYTVNAQLSDKTTLLNMHNVGVDKAAVRAERNFWKRNGEQKEEQWYKISGGFLATFVEMEIHTSEVYDGGGNWVYAIRQYYEKDLPAEVRKMVKSTYYDDAIGWVKEVWNAGADEDAPVYVVHIENSSSWKDLSIHDGIMEVLHSYRK